MYLSKHMKNGETAIHYFDSVARSDPSKTALVVCPGLSETADEYLDLLKLVQPRRSVILSFRGRGESGTPSSGYSLDEHISDIEAVVRDAGLNQFHLFSYSRGVSYALGYALKHKSKVKSIIAGEYPPEHRAMETEWPEDYINNYLVPFNRTGQIRPAAVRGIQKESRQIDIKGNFDMPVLVARGLLEGSLVTDTDIDRYKSMCPKLTIKEYSASGHSLKGQDKERFYNDIVGFIDNID
ncbi:alpha/beta hydrolase [Paenibacillus sp. N4]|uniref:alpha/beta fold hydrolase n=1 Tax=Paenibacillus vietnamensis TaxID=2590547 RepID=UPI001CD04DD5|nr:alpha/beta fold hydrolase [Paenibacillus vietnamensis]MCA0757755.1 alpha/beta hydrolase [Paenibacillus vietnamensis]